jgi:hypothetical protein
MDDSTRTHLANVRATDKTAQNAAYTCLMTTSARDCGICMRPRPMKLFGNAH